jgi:type IV secretion system T-DNA border endonuclease VirD2
MSAVPSVPELLQVGAAAPAHVDPVAAVMGEIRLRPGRGGGANLAAAAFQRDLRRRRAVAGALAPNPQALVKLIGSGGAKHAGGLRAQMAYLSREGDVPLRSSESTFGTEMSAEDARALAASWGLPETDRGGADRTSHFMVSFPQGTNPEAAERAGRAWAEALFDSGAHGDRWDYYTAFHTDTAYPHVHVVVGRRGLDDGTWLRISSRGAITFDRLREVQVEVAAREGIALTGTSRLARGVHDRPVPDAEYRRAQAAGRAAVAPAHSRVSAIAAAAVVLAHARDYEGAAAALSGTEPALAERLAAAAATLLEGHALVADRDAQPSITPEEAIRMTKAIEEKQDLVRANFEALDRKAAALPDPAARSGILRRIAELKGEAAPLVRADLGLQTYRPEVAHDDYRGLPKAEREPQAEREPPAALAIRQAADRKVAALAERFALSPDAALARYAGPGVSLGLGRDYRAEELAERAAGLAAQGAPPEREAEAAAQIADFHRHAAAVYREAGARLREIERERPVARSAALEPERPAARRAEIEPPEGRPAPRRVRDDDERSR